jgi:cytidyltransferase-like protein
MFKKRNIESKMMSNSYLIEHLKNKFPNAKIGMCHGVFDVLHSGHIYHFKQASSLVDVLIVSITSDRFVNKGPSRPINTLSDRMATIAGIEYIDFVIESDFSSSENNINLIQPNLYFKGDDYRGDSQDKNIDYAGNLNAETVALNKYGGEIYFTSEPVKSSSSIINEMKNVSPEEKITTDHLKSFFSKRPLTDLIKEIKEKRILLIGEVILDEYIFTESLGKSGKHPLVAEKEISRKQFLGGIVPLIDTFASFLKPKNLTVASVHSSEIIFKNSNFINQIILDHNYTEIKKTRYVNDKTNTFLFETYQMDDQYIANRNEQILLNILTKSVNEVDMLIALDFGHGLITPNMRSLMSNNYKNFAVNVQKNAGNKGFSSISKYSSAGLVVLNGDEVELELKQKGIDKFEAAVEIRKIMSAEIVVITDGSNGLIITNGERVVHVPALFGGKIVDRTGAGDSVFAMISLFSLVVDDLEVLGYLGNIAGAMNLNWFANEKSISEQDLINAVHFGLK